MFLQRFQVILQENLQKFLAVNRSQRTHKPQRSGDKKAANNIDQNVPELSDAVASTKQEPLQIKPEGGGGSCMVDDIQQASDQPSKGTNSMVNERAALNLQFGSSNEKIEKSKSLISPSKDADSNAVVSMSKSLISPSKDADSNAVVSMSKSMSAMGHFPDVLQNLTPAEFAKAMHKHRLKKGNTQLREGTSDVPPDVGTDSPELASKENDTSVEDEAGSTQSDKENAPSDEKHADKECGDKYILPSSVDESQSECTQAGKEEENKAEDVTYTFVKVFAYSKKCVHLSWMMTTQTPELFLDDRFETDSKFDVDRFKHYTQTGQTMDYVVWPALYLHKDGPLLQKGVAQPCSKK